MELELPESIRSMIGKKIDSLEAEARRALEYASVEGQEFHSTVVAALLGVDEVDLEEMLARLEKTDRLVLTLGEEELPDGSLATRYRFAHALYQNFLYGSLVNKRKIMLHSQAGEQLVRHFCKRAPQIATQLALHFERGRNFRRAVEYLIRAGDNTTRLYGNAEAAEHYTRALSLVEKLPDEEQGEIKVNLFGKRGATNMELSRFGESVDDYRSMLKHLEAFDVPEKKAAGLNALAKTLFFSHRLEEMEACVAEALVASGRAGSETLRLDTMCLMALKHVCYGELEVGRPMLDDVIKGARAIDYKPALLAALTWRGCLYFFQTEAISTLEAAIKMARRNGDRFWFPRMPNCIGWLHRELQDFEGAQRHNREGLEIARQYNVLEAEANSLINLGIDHTVEGKPQETIAAFRETRDIFKRDAWFRWRYNIRLEAATAWHWLRQGDLEKAGEFTQRLLDTANQHEVHKYIAEAHRLKAQIALAADDPAGAEAELAAALEELQRFPAPLIAWRTYSDLGRLQSEHGRRQDAQAAFTQAAAIVNACAANVTDEELRATFLNSKAVGQVMAGAAATATNVGGHSA
jgi:tetratricopeptide (TPR) repeat protein